METIDIDIEGYFKTIDCSIKSQLSLTKVNTIDIGAKSVIDIDIETHQLLRVNIDIGIDIEV